MSYDPTKVKVNLSGLKVETNNKDEEKLKMYISNCIENLEQINPFIGEGFFSSQKKEKR